MLNIKKIAYILFTNPKRKQKKYVKKFLVMEEILNINIRPLSMRHTLKGVVLLTNHFKKKTLFYIQIFQKNIYR